MIIISNKYVYRSVLEYKLYMYDSTFNRKHGQVYLQVNL